MYLWLEQLRFHCRRCFQWYAWIERSVSNGIETPFAQKCNRISSLVTQLVLYIYTCQIFRSRYQNKMYTHIPINIQFCQFTIQINKAAHNICLATKRMPPTTNIFFSHSRILSRKYQSILSVHTVYTYHTQTIFPILMVFYQNIIWYTFKAKRKTLAPVSDQKGQGKNPQTFFFVRNIYIYTNHSDEWNNNYVAYDAHT